MTQETADILIATLMFGGVAGAGLIATLYMRRHMRREDWADATSFDGPRRLRFFRVHGVRLLILLAGLFLWFLVVGTVVIPVVGRSVVAP